MAGKKENRRNIIALGWASFFTDLSSEMIFPLIPVFLVDVLGAGKAFVGLVEGIAEAISSLLKAFSGILSDRLGRRKPLVVFGYSFSAFSKGGFALATAPWHVLAARSLDRVGKGIRTAPRDAIIADSTVSESRGRWFGFHRAMDQSGALAGALIAGAVLKWHFADIRNVFYLSLVPAFIAVILLIFFVKEVKGKGPVPFALAVRGYTPGYWAFVGVNTLFNMGFFSYAFFILQADATGYVPYQVSLLWFEYNLVYVLVSYPAGFLLDRYGRKKGMLVAYLLFITACVVAGTVSAQLTLLIVFAVYGAASSMYQTASRTYVSELAGPEKRASGIGIFYLFTAAGNFVSSVAAGWLWSLYGASAAFALGVSAGLLSFILGAFLFRETGNTSQ